MLLLNLHKHKNNQSKCITETQSNNANIAKSLGRTVASSDWVQYLGEMLKKIEMIEVDCDDECDDICDQTTISIIGHSD